MTMTNWKNVNNWHWTGKNCITWAKDYINRQLVGLEAATPDGHVIRTNRVDVDGDVDLNQRKGKLITIYDVAITISWAGENVNGKIKLPEFMHDTEMDELEVEVTCEDETAAKEPFKELARTQLLDQIKQRLGGFAQALVEENTKDVMIDPSEFQKKAVTTSNKDGGGVNKNTEEKKEVPRGKIINTTTYTEDLDFQTSAHEMYETLLDEHRVRAWSRGNAKVERKVGGEIRLFDGNVTGEILELVPDKKIIQKWRMSTWPADHFSTVYITFDQASDHLTLHVRQEGVPVGEDDVLRRNWHGYYWNSIKGTFGFGAVF
ncbi:uncharacterized protein VTP21DRAFT_1788 [Calcarisporiella thermophila]|uniref:uncharacterized protein n=1 Tax=Calcarisporiella thermophila TaxID=911321 RepID=UPI003742FB04